MNSMKNRYRNLPVLHDINWDISIFNTFLSNEYEQAGILVKMTKEVAVLLNYMERFIKGFHCIFLANCRLSQALENGKNCRVVSIMST